MLSPCLHSKHSQTSVTCLFTAETYLTASGRCTSTARADCSTTAPRCSGPAGSRPATSSRPGTFVLVPAPRLPPPSSPGTCNCATQKQASSFIQCLCHLYLIESLEDFNTVRVILTCSATRYYRYLSAGSVQYSVPGSDTVWRTALDPATRLRYFYTGARAEWSLPTLDTHTGNT